MVYSLEIGYTYVSVPNSVCAWQLMCGFVPAKGFLYFSAVIRVYVVSLRD